MASLIAEELLGGEALAGEAVGGTELFGGAESSEFTDLQNIIDNAERTIPRSIRPERTIEEEVNFQEAEARIETRNRFRDEYNQRDQLIRNYQERNFFRLPDYAQEDGLTDSEYELMKDYSRQTLRRFYRDKGYNPEQIENLVKKQEEVNNLIRHYGYEPEIYDYMKEFYPDEIPNELEEQLDELNKRDQDETNLKSVEAEDNPNLRPRRVTFDDINREGFQSNFRRERDFSDARSSYRSRRTTSFKPDYSPKGAINNLLGKNAIENIFAIDYVQAKGGQGVAQIFNEVNNIYGMERESKEIGLKQRQTDRDRRVLGIVYSNESRDKLIGANLLPAYYSTSNIKRLLRNGVMPYGWNEEMAVQQGFGDDIAKVNFKEKTKDQSEEFLQRETTKAHIKATEGDLKNLRNRLKTRKLIQYYSQ